MKKIKENVADFLKLNRGGSHGGKEFVGAKIKLTSWYLLIIMCVSILFSIAIYESLTFELDRVERMHRARVELGIPEPRTLPRNLRIDPDLIAETKSRLKLTLGLINIIILGSSAVAGYLLAGKTLKPIAEMIEEQNRFITDSSHELRTPLTSLKTEIEVGLRDKNLDLNEAKRLLKSNLEEANNLQRLSDELIKLTQYQKQGLGISFSELSSLTVVESAIKKVEKIAKNKNIKIIKNDKNITFEGEEQSIEELIVILLDNAIKYSPQDTTVTVSTEKSDHHVLFKVIDQGVGIEKEDLPHILDRFYRSDTSRSKDDTSGYGLGLSIAKQIIIKHHASIDFESKVNKGTKVTVSFPLRQS